MQDLLLTATTFSGLEPVLAQELQQLGAKNIEIGKRAVSFEGDLGFLYKANYSLRTALRVLFCIKKMRASNEKQLYSKIRAINWNAYLKPQQTFAIDVVGQSERFHHSHYTAQLIKDAIVDRIRNDKGERPSVDTQNPTVPIHVFLDQDRIKISLDSSGAPLFKRGYRVKGVEAPINEVLAAGILGLMNWNANTHLLDPMCGSATFLIEAAMLATQTPAQYFRDHFAFENWTNFDKNLFLTIKETRNKRIGQKHFIQIFGYDKDPTALFSAQKNIQKAGFENLITLDKKDFFESEKIINPLTLIFNPPYDERLAADDVFYKNIGDTLKKHYAHTDAWFITANLEATKQVGLRSSRKIALVNGKLECKLFKYELYKGSKKEKNNNY